MIRAALLTMLVFLANMSPVPGQEPAMKPGVWHYRSIPCVDTTVIDVRPRLGTLNQRVFTAADFEVSGVQVTFATHLGVDPLFPREHAGVTHYQNTAGNDVMMSERPGDRVQVCFLGPPTPTQFCNPDADARGRTYRVYDYRQHASYAGSNSEHDCGGA